MNRLPRARTGRRWQRIVLGTVAVAVLAAGALVAAAVLTGAAPGQARRVAGPVTRRSPPPATPSPAATRARLPRQLPVGQMGRYAVAELQLRLVDRSRPRLGPRILLTTVQYPVVPAGGDGPLARGLFPLVVFAPGYRQCPGEYGALLHAWASAGYVVAGVEFPRTSCHVTAPYEPDLTNQPADMAFVIRQMLDLTRAPRGMLAGRVNPARIAVAGQSDGGDTVAAVAANTCCLDRRVRATIVLAGAEWPPLGGSYFARPTPPMLFVQGTADLINLPADSLTMYQADRSGPRYYLDLFGAGHLPPFEGRRPPEPVVARVTLAFLNRYLAGQRRASSAMWQVGNVTGVAALVAGGRPPPP